MSNQEIEIILEEETIEKLKKHCKSTGLLNMSQFVDMAINEKLARQTIKIKYGLN